MHAGTVDDRMYVPVFKRLNSRKSLPVRVVINLAGWIVDLARLLQWIIGVDLDVFF